MIAEVAMELKIGSVVMLYNSFLKAKIADIAVIYEIYKDFDNSNFNGVSILTQCGVDLGGFSFVDTCKYLEFVRHTDLEYKFTNVIKLQVDFKRGLFTKCFK